MIYTHTHHSHTYSTRILQPVIIIALFMREIENKTCIAPIGVFWLHLAFFAREKNKQMLNARLVTHSVWCAMHLIWIGESLLGALCAIPQFT